jgi:hemoglobin/transferrin/lactoferrin receptor protein
MPQIACSRVTQWLVGVGMAFVCAPLLADLDGVHTLDQVTVVGTKTKRTLAQTPGTITVKTRAQLQRELAQSIKDALRYEAGVSVANQPSRFGLAGFNIRGLDGNRVLIEIDGARTADSFSIGSFSSAGRDAVELDVLKRIDIVRGSASSLYGSSAMGGVVAFTTLDPADLLKDAAGLSQASEFRLGFSGENQARYGNAIGAFGTERLGALLTLSQRRFEPYETDGLAIDGAARGAPNPQDSERRALLGKFGGQLSEAHYLMLTLDLSLGDTATDVRSSLGRQVLGPTTIDTTSLLGDDQTERRRAALSWRFGSGWSFAERLDFKLYGQASDTVQRTTELRTSTTRGVATPSRRDRRFDFSQNLRGLELRAERDWGVPEQNGLRLVYGVSLIDTETDQLRDGVSVNLLSGVASSVIGPDAFPVRDFPRSQTRETAAYAQLEWQRGRFSLIPGLRLDRYALDPKTDAIFSADNPGITPTSLTETELSPKLGALLRFTPGLVGHFSYAEGFRAPPFNDVNVGFTNLQFGYTAIPNPNLSSESSRSVELGMRARGDFGFVDLTHFQNRYANFIESFVLVGVDNGVSVFQSQNLSRVKIRGAELRGELSLGAWQRRFERYSLRAAASVQSGDDLAASQPLNSIDPRRAVLGVVRQGEATRLELAGTFVSRKARVDERAGALLLPGGYATLDLLSQWQVSHAIRLDAGLFNLTDRQYFDWADVRGRRANDPAALRFSRPGRSLGAALHFSF